MDFFGAVVLKFPSMFSILCCCYHNFVFYLFTPIIDELRTHIVEASSSLISIQVFHRDSAVRQAALLEDFLHLHILGQST